MHILHHGGHRPLEHVHEVREVVGVVGVVVAMSLAVSLFAMGVAVGVGGVIGSMVGGMCFLGVRVVVGRFVCIGIRESHTRKEGGRGQKDEQG